jgi:hypothetical protein
MTSPFKPNFHDAPAAQLRGFAGIKAGMGVDEFALDLETIGEVAQIVALTGPNGAGKTTVIDNLHPYRLMPSRATSLSPAGFSFYEHLAAAEGLKELDWVHLGVRYRSTLLFRANGRRTTDAYVYEIHDGALRPVVLPDGTVSNGSNSAYDRIIEALLGSAETFFTAAFSAQNRRAWPRMAMRRSRPDGRPAGAGKHPRQRRAGESGDAASQAGTRRTPRTAEAATRGGRSLGRGDGGAARTRGGSDRQCRGA